MPWKLREISYREGEEDKTLETIETDANGNPVWVHESDGKETGVDAQHYFTKIPELIADNKKMKDARKAVEAELQNIKDQFEGIEDAGAAKEALEKIKTIKDKKLIDAGKVDEVKAQMQEQFNGILEKKETEHKTQFEDLTRKYNEANGQIHRLTISNTFKSSPILTGPDKMTAIPVEMIEKYFGGHFRPVEKDGKLVPVGFIGDKEIMSASKPGEFASFDEAIMHLIDTCPFKEQILAGANSSGGGSDGAQDRNPGGSANPSARFGHIRMLGDFKDDKEKLDFIKVMGRDEFTKVVNNTRFQNAQKK